MIQHSNLKKFGYSYVYDGTSNNSEGKGNNKCLYDDTTKDSEIKCNDSNKDTSTTNVGIGTTNEDSTANGSGEPLIVLCDEEPRVNEELNDGNVIDNNNGNEAIIECIENVHNANQGVQPISNGNASRSGIANRNKPASRRGRPKGRTNSCKPSTNREASSNADNLRQQDSILKHIDRQSKTRAGRVSAPPVRWGMSNVAAVMGPVLTFASNALMNAII